MSITLKADLIANYLKRDLISHTRKVQSLFKRMVRNEEAWLLRRFDIRYSAALVRARFEENRHVKDMRVAKQLLEEGEIELFKKMHPQPKYFTSSPGGVCFERYIDFPDWHMDTWHPLEKAQYPYYFARREARKKEYIKMWEKTWGRPAIEDQHH